MQSREFNADYVRRLVEGDPPTREHFTSYFGELLHIKLRTLLRSRSEIDEGRQETFFRVWKALSRKDGEGLKHPEKLGSFVNSVCNNVLSEMRVYEARHPLLSELGEDWIDHRMDLDAPLVDKERRRLVKGVLAELPARDREVLRMLYLEGAPREEVQARLGVDQDYLRVVLYRARSRFRKRLK